MICHKEAKLRPMNILLGHKPRRKQLTIMDFSHVYKKETFYEKENVCWLDCSEIHGTNGYCDESAIKQIKEKIMDLPAEGLHFIDSGNFHYVTEFWVDKIEEAFALIVFDHHSDMQKPLFGDILSCGSWIMNALEHNTFLKKVVLIGIGKEQEECIPEKYKDKVICADDKETRTRQFWNRLEGLKLNCPIYISIDKDVLSKKIVDTTWDQGDMKLTELKNILHTLLIKQKVIGVDICGECSNQLSSLCDTYNDNDLNQNLLQFFKTENTKMIELYHI